ncbi:2-C-methyl-D-erythritol 4-phosphate cytidylyltransferase [Nocardioides sp. zg-1228]|uniref:2-C-methyl-D-erythritol 4-phosphate cytidylyltransferase n=1 Tax=Nocardioides sp. zg-1228 TaxID=2763008 RepID=UPI0016436896|nr:2-C-methyl-D-erythritol 4-phosphate cytidylyltransferase [Nocardioides sp. zg-1228]MBC2932768.1 2-C-methyl-D-erythritol 4-phosphate cytidylyltransferase [Nocardioides sp. zg-1228]QSF58239.1 2-C-methyl-D-erythritol 4-phosphate cytidylyltransferase [Nocardioides sp. zg-1228]
MDDADRGPWDDVPRGLGVVLDEDRGALPYELIHGEALVACAAWGLGDAGVDLVDGGVSWAAVVESGRDVVLHDALCPMTPPDFIDACLQRARESDHPVVGTRPVTDTVKVVSDGVVGQTLDRDSLVAVASPLVIPAAVLASLPRRPASDLARAVADLEAAGHPVEALQAPPEGRRVSSPDDVRLLAALTQRPA